MGRHTPATQTYEPDFESGTYMLGFWNLMRATGVISSNTDLNTGARGDYSQGNCLFGFNFSPEMESGSSPHFDVIRKGKLDLEIKLARPHDHPITLIILMEYDHLI